ncbi:hypothetical protein C0033_22405 [Clostridium sp. chh4-2]|nr:hypothetical protein C0033_22405 [Clostridium sp. chh4-2]
MKINGIVWNPLEVLRPARTKRDRTAPIRSELLMTSLLKGRLEPDSEFSFYLSLFILADLSTSKGFHTIPLIFILPPPAWASPSFRLLLD